MRKKGLKVELIWIIFFEQRLWVEYLTRIFVDRETTRWSFWLQILWA